MSRKSPPPRPPAPKMSSGSSLSFSFKALEEEDDEELTVFTGEFDKKVHEEKERQSRELERQRSASKSPASLSLNERVTQTSTPVVKSQNSFEKLKDLTGKFPDKISKMIEDFSTETAKQGTGISEENRKESSTSNGHDQAVMKSEVGGGDLEVENEFVDCKDDDNAPQSETVSSEAEGVLEINEDYYDKNSKDFSDLPLTETVVRQRKTFSKPGKIKPVKPPAPVSMSGLNQKLTDDSQKEKPMESSETNKNTNYSEKDKEDTSHIVISGAKVPVRKLVGITIFIFFYMIIPLPSYLSGMIAGMILSSGGWLLYLWITEPPKPRQPIPDDLPLDKLPPMPIAMPALKEPKGDDHGIYKGWMNEILDYVPDSYSINHTHSIYVHLEGTTLRLRRPKVNVPKRAMWDEQTISPQFIHQRHFDVKGSKVLLLPPGLVKKRLWSKKYPICIALANTGQKPFVKQDTNMEIHTESKSGGMSTSPSDDSVHGFEVVQENKLESDVLYLFARTCHEKEIWFRRFSAASKGTPWKNHILEVHRILNSSQRHRRSSSSDSLKQKRQESIESLSSVSSNSPCTEDTPLADVDLKDFVMYMSRLLPKERDSLPSSPAHMGTLKDKQEPKTGDIKLPSSNGAKAIICDPALLPINALLGRCFWDFLRDTYWSGKVKEKLQKKLSKIHIPYFIEELKISDIDLGTEVPVIRRTNKPYLDENGFWVDLDLTYSGKFKMTIETKVNLLKLKEKSSKVHKEKTKEQRSAVTDSEEEDSAESSTDEEDDPSMVGEDGSTQAGTGKKLMKYINKITASKYFQSATENKYIKKAMTEVSNTRLILTVELQKLNGTLAINIPVPPSDRIWYGFRGNPQLWLVAKPKVGEREVTMSHITEWIEKKLTAEFQHVLVMPNMDDLVIPILLPDVAVAEACCEPHPHLGSEV